MGIFDIFREKKQEKNKSAEEDDGSIDVDFSDVEESNIGEKDPHIVHAEVNEEVDTGLAKVFGEETLKKKGPEAEIQKELMNNVVDDLVSQPPFSSQFEGLEGVAEDFKYYLKKAMAPEMQKYLDTGSTSPIELRMSSDEMYKTLLKEARAHAAALLKKFNEEGKLRRDLGKKAA